MKLALKTIGISILSISMLISFGLTSNQAFALGHNVPQTCAGCDLEFDQCTAGPTLCREQLEDCRSFLQILFQTSCVVVGGEFIGIETTSVLAAGAQYTAAWMIPVIVSAIGIAIVIARKF